MTTLNYKQLMTILNVLKDARKEQSTITYQHDAIVKLALDGDKEKLDYLVEIQQANYDKKITIEHTYYAIEEMIKEY